MGKSIGGQFVPVLHETLDAPAWLALSHGARLLYVALKREVPRSSNRAYLSYRKAGRALKAGFSKVSEWYAELEHYGFIVLHKHGSLGVDGKGKAPHWRLTELGHAAKAGTEFPSKDYLRWTGELFDPTPYRIRHGRKKWHPGKIKKQNPATPVGNTPLPTAVTPPLPTTVTPKSGSATHEGNIGNGRTVTRVHSKSRFTTGEADEGGAEPLDERIAFLERAEARRKPR